MWINPSTCLFCLFYFQGFASPSLIFFCQAPRSDITRQGKCVCVCAKAFLEAEWHGRRKGSRLYNRNAAAPRKHSGSKTRVESHRETLSMGKSELGGIFSICRGGKVSTRRKITRHRFYSSYVLIIARKHFSDARFFFFLLCAFFLRKRKKNTYKKAQFFFFY